MEKRLKDGWLKLIEMNGNCLIIHEQQSRECHINEMNTLGTKAQTASIASY